MVCDKIDIFSNKNSATLYLNPKTSVNGIMKEIHSRLNRLYPSDQRKNNFKEHIGKKKKKKF